MFANFVVVLTFLAVLGGANAGFSEAYLCSGCTIVLGLVEEAGLQIRLDNYLRSQCTNKVCEEGVTQLIRTIESQANPDTVCKNFNLCSGNLY